MTDEQDGLLKVCLRCEKKLKTSYNIWFSIKDYKRYP